MKLGKKHALFNSVLSLILCISMLLGTTFAWFTDSVTSENNIIKSGRLEAAMKWKNPGETEEQWKDASTGAIFNYEYWEPGYVEAKCLKLENTGNLAFQYRLFVVPNNDMSAGMKLAEVLDVYVSATEIDERADIAGMTRLGTLKELMINPNGVQSGVLLPQVNKGAAEVDVPTTAHSVGSATVCIALKMQETAGNEYQNQNFGDGFKVQLLATQYTYEKDSFGSDYDTNSQWPEGGYIGTPAMPGIGSASGSETVTVDNDRKTTGETLIKTNENGVSAKLPAGVKMADGATAATFTKAPKTTSDSNITAGDGEQMASLDVHVEGVAADNTTPIIVDLGKVLPVGMNMGNIALYHVENGVTNEMTQVFTYGELDAHNEFYYDPATGFVTVAMATFSEIAVVADTENEWNGTRDYTWYDDGKNELTIANADQLAAFGAIVGGMDERTQDSFSGKTVKLIADINLGDKESENNPDLIFYPIGYYNNEGTYGKTDTAITSGFKNFEGTFDGNGHTIANFYQNTWEMKGDNNYYDASLQYYRDGMGLFGRVYGGTVKNLTVKNFSSDGEYTTTGTIAAYADGATFENIAIFNCNPRVYNIGNGGIVGCVGWYAKEANLRTTFKNITVDNSNKISALWGSYDVACGGLVGQYYPTSGQSSANYPVNGGIHMENCHVAAQMDVYNDVCGNYQYYAYRYAGILIGSVRENETIDGHSYPKMDGITAEGCTVHFGDWNDYYYCELVDNTTASYTHDHQMSRLVEIKEINGTTITYLDGTTGTVPASGRANYVIVDYTKGHGTENATCYHFKDGKGWNHDDAGKETVNGVEVLKEDKQHIYLEFNNLVTGYGWGVTSKGVDDMDGVTILDRQEGSSVEKFAAADTAKKSYTTGETVTIGELFKALAKPEEEINPQSIRVAVSPVGENSTAGGTYTANTADWTQGTLSFSGIGAATITITDYYFCTPTTINVTITERVAEEKFEVVMNNGDFLHRVGNSGTVALDKLFKAKDGVTAGTVSVTVDAVDGTGASGTYSNNVIQFNGTGVVKVTIKDDDAYCTPTELYLEVVDAVNATSATSATKNNVVLLNDCGFSSLDVSGGYTLYGNGFTMTCSSDSVAIDRSYGFVTLENGTLDNVQIVAPNFSHSILYDKNKTEGGNPSQTDSNGKTRYYNIRSAVVMTGNSKIINSYMSGGRAVVYAVSGNPIIENTTIKGGAAANIHVEHSNVLTLKDVTLIQKPIQATVNDTTKTVMGFSVALACDADGKGAPVTLEGTLRQYAWAHEGYKQYVPSDGEKFVEEALDRKNYIHKITYDNGVTADSVNLGFVYMPLEAIDTTYATNIEDKRTDGEKANVPYDVTSVNGQRVSIYTYKNTNGTHDGMKTEPSYTPNKQGASLPSFSFTDANADRIFTTEYDATNGWTSTLKVDVDAGNYTFSFDKLLAQKYGQNLNYTVKDANGAAVDKDTAITLSASAAYEFILTTTDNQIYDKAGAMSGETATHTHKFVILATKTSLPAPTWTSTTLNGTPYIVVDSKDGDWNCAVPVLDGLKIKYWSKKQNKEVELDLSTVVSAANLSNGSQNNSNNTITIKVTDEYTLQITTTGFKTNDNGKPVVVEGKLYFTVSSSSNYVSKNTTSRSPSISYVFTDANNSDSITLNTNFEVKYDAYKKTQYKYSSFCSGELKEASSSCVTPDTLITLADGSQKRIDEVTFEDRILTWDFFTGSYVERDISILVYHGDDVYDIANMEFSDGTQLKTIGEHGVFDYDMNCFVYITPDNVADYVGHRFVKQNLDGGYDVVTLTKGYASKEYTGSYSLSSAETSNAFASGMLTIAPPKDFYNWIEMDGKLQYDAEQFAKDVETYGLYTYEDFKDYVTYEQFIDWNGAYLKIPVEKGYFTFEYILELIELYKGWMP